MNKRFWFFFGGNQLRATGKTLRALDLDDVGAEDVIGAVCEGGGRALLAYGQDNLSGFRSYLKQVADGIYEYLGLPVPGEEAEAESESA